MKLLLAALFALSALPSQEKITLAYRPKAGDKLTLTQKMEMNAKLTVDAGGVQQSLSQGHKESQKKHVEILEVKDDRVTKASFHMEEHVQETSQPGSGEGARVERPLHGKKAVATVKDGKVVYEGLEGDEDAKKEFELEDDFSKAFPKKPVAVGDSWDVTGEALRSIFDNEKIDGKLTLKLAEIKDHQGKRCAFLDAQLDVKGKDEEGPELAIKVKGPIIVWIERGYTLQAKLEGTVSINLKTDEAKVSGDGPMKIEMTAALK